MGRQGTLRDNVVAVPAWSTHASRVALRQNDSLWLANSIAQRYRLLRADAPNTATAERIYQHILNMSVSAPLEALGPFLTEVEAHEAHTTYLLLQERTSGTYVGCARLVAHDPNHPDALLPLEARCIEGLRATQHRPWPRASFCEIDLLAIHPTARFHPSSALKAVAPRGHDESPHPHFPAVESALYLALHTLQQQQGIVRALILLEPGLARILCSLGMDLQPLSETFALYGTRAVYINAPTPPHALQPVARALDDTMRQQLLEIQSNPAPLAPWIPDQMTLSPRPRGFSYRGG